MCSTLCLAIASAARFQTSRCRTAWFWSWPEGLLEHGRADLDLLDRRVLDGRIAPALVSLLVGNELVGERLPVRRDGQLRAPRGEPVELFLSQGLAGFEFVTVPTLGCLCVFASGVPDLLDLLVELTDALSLLGGVLHDLGVGFLRPLKLQVKLGERVAMLRDRPLRRTRRLWRQRRFRLDPWPGFDELGHRCRLLPDGHE